MIFFKPSIEHANLRITFGVFSLVESKKNLQMKVATPGELKSIHHPQMPPRSMDVSGGIYGCPLRKHGLETLRRLGSKGSESKGLISRPALVGEVGLQLLLNLVQVAIFHLSCR